MSLERGEQSCVVQLENTPRWEWPKVTTGNAKHRFLGEFQSTNTEGFLVAFTPQSTALPYEKNQGVIKHGKAKDQFP